MHLGIQLLGSLGGLLAATASASSSTATAGAATSVAAILAARAVVVGVVGLGVVVGGPGCLAGENSLSGGGGQNDLDFHGLAYKSVGKGEQ